MYISFIFFNIDFVLSKKEMLWRVNKINFSLEKVSTRDMNLLNLVSRIKHNKEKAILLLFCDSNPVCYLTINVCISRAGTCC